MEQRRPSVGTIPARAGVPACAPRSGIRVVLGSRTFHMEFTCRHVSTVAGGSCTRGGSPRRFGDGTPRYARVLPSPTTAVASLRSQLPLPPEPCPLCFPSHHFTRLMTSASKDVRVDRGRDAAGCRLIIDHGTIVPIPYPFDGMFVRIAAESAGFPAATGNACSADPGSLSCTLPRAV